MENGNHSGGAQRAGRYQLRHAAGLYWLIDMEQSGEKYISPVPLNESGAMLWRMLYSGASRAEICESFAAGNGISIEQARIDTDDFIRQLKTMHVDLGVLE